MAALRCSCEQGRPLWGEFWWVGGGHRWAFFEAEKTSETYAEQVTLPCVWQDAGAYGA